MSLWIKGETSAVVQDVREWRIVSNRDRTERWEREDRRGVRGRGRKGKEEGKGEERWEGREKWRGEDGEQRGKEGGEHHDNREHG